MHDARQQARLALEAAREVTAIVLGFTHDLDGNTAVEVKVTGGEYLTHAAAANALFNAIAAVDDLAGSQQIGGRTQHARSMIPVHDSAAACPCTPRAAGAARARCCRVHEYDAPEPALGFPPQGGSAS